MLSLVDEKYNEVAPQFGLLFPLPPPPSPGHHPVTASPHFRKYEKRF